MNFIQLIVGILITLIVTVKVFTVKVGTKSFSSKNITFANAIFLFLVLLISFPFMKSYIIPFDQIKLIPLIASILKGVFLYFISKFLAELAKESNSSSVFAGYMSLGIGAILNNLLLNENLTFMQILSCIFLSSIGVIFFFKGPASDLSKYSKKLFLIIIAISVSIMMVDKIAISGLNWYMYLLINGIFMFFISLITLIKDKQVVFVKKLLNYKLVLIGLVYAVGEFVILYSMQHYIPVSIAILFVRLSAPIVMVISAYLYHERTPKEQLIFGGLSLLVALPLLLFK